MKTSPLRLILALAALAAPALLFAASGKCVTCDSYNCIWAIGNPHSSCTTWGGGSACVASGSCEPE